MTFNSHRIDRSRPLRIAPGLSTARGKTATRGAFPRILAGLVLAAGLSAAHGQASPNLPVFTSPIDITGGRLSFDALAPDRETGVMVRLPLPPGLFSGPKLSILTGSPLNLLFDSNWTGTLSERTAGTAPIKAACDGPSGVAAQVTAQVAALGHRAYGISCDFASKGAVYVKQVGNALYLSYQLTNNTVAFRSTSGLTCRHDNGTFACPNDPRFTVRFAVEMLTVIWAPAFCTIRAEAPNVYLHGVQIESHNVAADLARFFDGNRFTAAEAALQAREVKGPVSIDAYLSDLRTNSACGGQGADARLLASFSQLETEIKLPQGIVFHVVHPAIAPPRIQNSLASSAPQAPSFARPSIATQPVVAAGAQFEVSGRFFPLPSDPTRLPLAFDRNSSAACNGGASELESVRQGDAAVVARIAASAGTWSSCASRFDAAGLLPSTHYRFRVRDCDAITCSPWSGAYDMTTGAASPAAAPVTIVLDTGAALGSVAADASGSFQATATMPAGTPVGAHFIRAFSGQATDTTPIQVTGPNGPDGHLMVTAAFFGDQGCPMRQAQNVVPAAREFSLFGSGFAAGAVTIRLNSPAGTTLGTAVAKADGTFCGTFTGPAFGFAGSQVLVALQSGTQRASLPVSVVIVRDPA